MTPTANETALRVVAEAPCISYCTAPPHDDLCRMPCNDDEDGRHPKCVLAALDHPDVRAALVDARCLHRSAGAPACGYEVDGTPLFHPECTLAALRPPEAPDA